LNQSDTRWQVELLKTSVYKCR